eukprot:1850370-Alexandrium_andersonii.AAC.1
MINSTLARRCHQRVHAQRERNARNDPPGVLGEVLAAILALRGSSDAARACQELETPNLGPPWTRHHRRHRQHHLISTLMQHCQNCRDRKECGTYTRNGAWLFAFPEVPRS